MERTQAPLGGRSHPWASLGATSVGKRRKCSKPLNAKAVVGLLHCSACLLWMNQDFPLMPMFSLEILSDLFIESERGIMCPRLRFDLGFRHNVCFLRVLWHPNFPLRSQETSLLHDAFNTGGFGSDTRTAVISPAFILKMSQEC